MNNLVYTPVCTMDDMPYNSSALKCISNKNVLPRL